MQREVCAIKHRVIIIIIIIKLYELGLLCSDVVGPTVFGPLICRASSVVVPLNSFDFKQKPSTSDNKTIECVLYAIHVDLSKVRLI